MKGDYTMKKIFSILLTVTALFAFAPIISAQHTINDEIVDEGDNNKPLSWPKDNGVQQPAGADFAYSKNISAPQSNGTYWIKLESFSTGSATYIESAAPADIVLVLDLSSSMTNTINHSSYSEATPPTGGWTVNTFNGGNYYIYYDGDYRQIFRGGNNNNRRYVYFDISNTRYYLLSNGTIQQGGNAPSYQNTQAINYTGTLYTVTTSSETRLAALKRATKAFIDEIEINDKYEDEAGTVERTGGRLGNRISLITFNSSATTHNTLAEGELADATETEKSTADKLKDLVDGFSTVTGTTPYNGFVAANAQLAAIPEARRLVSSRTIVFFTDGEPYDQNDGNGSYPSSPNNAYRYKAIAEALKSKTKDNTETDDVEGYDATVYSVGLFSTSPTTGSTTWNFLNYVSSNAPNATAINNAGANFDGGGKYYYDASDENVDLTDVFTEIAHQSGGSSTSLSAASSNVDVVSNSFVLPDNTTLETVDGVVKIFVAKLNETNGIVNGKYNFDPECIKEYVPDDWTYYELDENGERVSDTPKKVAENISVTLQGTHGIKVTGFDYSSCFCGPVEEGGQIVRYQGYKIIIMIPIKMNPDAIGGPNVETNAPGSGIFVSDQSTSALIQFKSPTISLPVNIYIKKTGLDGGESAKFMIERTILPDVPEGQEVDPTTLTGWTYVSTVFVTKSKDATTDPVVKVRGMPANMDVAKTTVNDAGEVVPVLDDDGKTVTEQKDLVYRIREENWSWSYDPQTNAQYTSTKNVENPFTFGNKKKDNIDVKVRHAESKATNIFMRGIVENNVKYDDSKTNDRTKNTGSNTEP